MRISSGGNSWQNEQNRDYAGLFHFQSVANIIYFALNGLRTILYIHQHQKLQNESNRLFMVLILTEYNGLCSKFYRPSE